MTSTLFRGGTLLDGTGATPAVADVLIREGRVVDVGIDLDGADLRGEIDDVVDCAGCTVLPGLFDCHVHVLFDQINLLRMLQTPFSYPYYQAIGRLRATLATGVTWVRDAGGADLGVADALRTGLISGPRMQVALTMISQTGGHGDGVQPCGIDVPLFGAHPGRPRAVVDGSDDMRRVVRELVRAGADVIKVATSGGVMSPRSDPRHGHFRDAEIETLVAEASAAGLFVMAHAQATDGIKVAVRNGVRSVEHGIYLDDEAIEMMLDHGTWLVPTLSAPRAVIAQADAGAPLSDAAIAKARMVTEAHDDSIRRAIAAGVTIAMGTDSGVGPHGTNLEELALMASLGMDPLDAWVATTSSAARLLGVQADYGTLEPGKVGDVVVLEGAYDDLSGLRERVREVYQDGVRVAD
ncbi:MAG: amidohydrolase family protein [Ornithinimicrobium sp.]